MSLTKLKDKISNSGKNSDKYKIIFQFDFLNFITFGQWEPDQLILRFKRGNIQKTELTPNWLTTAKTKYGTMGKVLWQKPTSVDFILGLYPNSKLSCGYDEKMITISIENISPSNKSTKLAEYTFNLAEFVGKTKESQLLEIDCPTVSWKIALARLGITMKTSLIKKSKSSNDLQEDYLIEKGHGYENNKENEDPVKPSKYFSSNELDINKIFHVHDEPSSSSRNNSMTDRNGRQLHYFKTASILMEKKSFKQVKALYIRRSKTTDIDHCNGIRNYATKAYNDAYLTCINVDKIKINPDFTPKYRDAPLSISENHISMQVSKIFRGYFDHAYHSLCIDSLPVGRFITASFSSQYSKIHKDSYNQIVTKNRWKECSMRQSTLSHLHEFDVLGFTIAMDDQDQSAASSFGSSSQIYSNGTDGQQGDDEGEPWWPSVKNSSKLNQSAVDEDPRYFVCDSSNLPMTPDLEIQRQSVSASSINQQQQKEENEISPLSNEAVSVTEEITTDQACNIISSNAKEKHELIALEKSKASDELKMEISTLGEVISGLKYALGDKDSHIRQLHDLVSRLESYNDKLNQEMKQTTDEIDNFRFQIKTLQSTVTQLQEKLSLLREEEEERKSKIAKNAFPRKVNLCGWLHKKGALGPTKNKWRKRWFVADQWGFLYYYKYSNSSTPLGFIDTVEISYVEAKPDHEQNKNCCLFDVVTNERMYQLMAENEEDMDRWVAALDYLRTWSYCKRFVNYNRSL